MYHPVRDLVRHLIGCGDRRMPPARDDWPEVEVGAEPISVKSTSVPQVAATPLWEEYDRDEATAEEKYGRRVVAVTGMVGVVTTEKNEYMIGLEVEPPGPRQKGAVPPGVVCVVSERAVVARVKMGGHTDRDRGTTPAGR